MKTHSSIVVVLLSVTASATAMAQGRPWLADRSYGEGMGIRTGDLELHPSVAGEVGYDTNYFQRSSDTGPAYLWDGRGPTSALRFRVTPALTLSTLSPQRKLGDAAGGAAPPVFNFSAGIFASYNELVRTDGSELDDMGKQRHIDGGANLLVDILPQRPLGADIGADFVRVVSPSNDPALRNSWNRDTIHGGLGVTWRPGGGLFEWRIGYDALYNYFESSAFQSLNNARNNINTRGRWKFYPRTALVYDAQTYWVSYTGNSPARNNGEVIQARLGLNGLVTNQFALLALAGWATTHFEDTRVHVPENLNTFVGQAEIKWFILPQPKLQPGDATVGLSSLALGYLRDFSPSYLADFYRRDRVYGNVSYFVGGRFLVDVQAGYARITHPRYNRLEAGGTQSEHAGLGENRVDAQLFTEYRTSDSFGINATLRYDASLSRAEVRLTNPDATGGGPAEYIDNLAFSRFTGWVGVRWFM